MSTSNSWDLIDPDLDAEVTKINSEPAQNQVNQVANTSPDSIQVNPDQSLQRVDHIGPSHQLGTLYNQDFFVADTTATKKSWLYKVPSW